jgi:hypothetical protein
MTEPLHLMLYDATCTGRRALPGLSHAWASGALLYRALARFDATCGVHSWEQGLRWLAAQQPDRPIASVQFWGHGKWGCALVNGEPLSEASLEDGHAHRPWLDAIRSRLQSERSLWWFRTCETFGADRGHHFARACTQFFGCRAAGHTYIIAAWQSGLHSLAPGESPRWSPTEGLLAGDAAHPIQARWSGPREPHTISCLRSTIPAGY